MSIEIKNIVVIGSGVMGAGIAAHCANAGANVTMLDIVPDGLEDRSALAKGALERLKKSDPAALTHKSKAKNISVGNLQDDLEAVRQADWIIEAVLEDLQIKKDLYAKIQELRKSECIISSNTSTIPLASLVEGRSNGFKKHFLITHFFNPPRYMRLLELVTSDDTSLEVSDAISSYCDERLGKGVVVCNDTPGFIANRIGCYWLTAAVIDAFAVGISVEEADSVMSRPIGVPKTGVFGLIDLIGLDLMPLIAKSFKETLAGGDDFLRIYDEPQMVKDMIESGYTGRKGKGGFYRLNKDGAKKVKEAKNLQDGEYRPADKPNLDSVKQAKKGLRYLLEADDIGGEYARKVLLKVLSYTASLVPEISGDIKSVDEAMKLGYNWKYGPFELIDKLGGDDMAGPKWLAEKLKQESMDVPELLIKAGDKSFYNQQELKRQYLGVSGTYCDITVADDSWMLSDKKLGKKPVAKNPSASLWDIGDGILCLEYTSKMNSVDPMILEMMAKSVDVVKEGFQGLVIANDADNFCVGANIGILLFAANVAAWKQIREIIKQGQDVYMGLKYAPFPVVTAVSGMALGGGCELLMHSDKVQAHIETYTGLVEVGVGIVPGWGGCKEMIRRQIDARLAEQSATAKLGRMFSSLAPAKTLNTMPAISKAFEYIATARVAKSAEEAREMLILTDKDGITMNRQRLLNDAKDSCLELAQNYQPPESFTVSLPGKTARTALNMAIKGFVKSGKATPYDEVVSKAVAEVVSGGETDILQELTEQDLLDLELDVFMRMVKQKGTMDRLEHMLETGKPLRN